MRKFTFSLLIVFIAISTAHAQIQKGTTVLGGSINFSQKKIETGQNINASNLRRFDVAPLFAKAIRKNIIVGGDIKYGHDFESHKSAVNSNSVVNNNSYGLGVFVRGYRNIGKSGFYLFLQSRLGAAITEQKTKYTDSGNEPFTVISKSNGFAINLNLSPGIAYAITPMVHIETGLDDLFHAGYFNNSRKDNQEMRSNGFSAGIGLGGNTTWTVGVKFFLGKGAKNTKE